MRPFVFFLINHRHPVIQITNTCHTKLYVKWCIAYYHKIILFYRDLYYTKHAVYLNNLKCLIQIITIQRKTEIFV